MTPQYDHLSKEELIGILHKRDATRKLGLVWERDEVEHEKALNDDFVILELNQDLSVGQAPYGNILIEGDNFDALRYLHMAYKGRVKCIYIDPPYNTGRKDFIFNDRFVDIKDGFRHSKWLEYMYRRLLLARDFLSEDGVIFVSIDDIEVAHLSLLMDKIFYGKKVGTFVWRRRSGSNDEKDWFLSTDHEYVLCYANKDFTFAGTTKALADYANPDNDPRGSWVSSDLAKAHTFKQRPDAYYPIQNPETGTWYPCATDRVWGFATRDRVTGKKIRTQTMEQLIKEERVLWPPEDTAVSYGTIEELRAAIKDGSAPKNLMVYLHIEDIKTQVARGQAPERLLSYIEPLEVWVGRKIGYGKPRFKRFSSELKRSEKPMSTWLVPAAMKKKDLPADLDEITHYMVGYTREGTALLTQILGHKDFPYPKPMSLIKSLVGQATDGESGHIVMDFFAGSGTTGHAVLALNEEDGGNRSFILISSTEATDKEPEKNVCRDITSKRLRAAIEGYSYRTPKGTVTVDGLGGEFAYMRTRRVSRETMAIDIQHDQVWYALQQLHVNAVSPFDVDNSIQVLDGGERGYDIIYIPRLDSKIVSTLVDRAETSLRPCTIYTWQPGVIEQRLSESHVTIEKIPDYLIERFGRVNL